MIEGTGDSEESVTSGFWLLEVVSVIAVRMTCTLNTFAGMMVMRTPERLVMMSVMPRLTLTL